MLRRVLVVLAATAATVVASEWAAAAESPQSSAVQGSKVYLVRIAGKPTATYKGDIAGFAKTAPDKGGRYNALSSEAQMYARRLELQHDALLASVGASNSKLYSYAHVLNGFSARLTPQQADMLRKDKSVLNVWEDRAMPVDTNNTPKFLGLTNPATGLRAALGLTGEGIIIGIIDTGIVQEHPSFADNNYDEPPPRWHGICRPGEGWTTADCNNKLIGARWLIAGFSANSNLAPGDFRSARDSDGHGTHVASTAGGNRVKATLNGHPVANISGMAYRAHIAVYKACWQAPNEPTGSCAISDTVAATDAAVADGVDIINFSISTDPSFVDPQDLAFLDAFDAGVFVARSGGNEGPSPGSMEAGEPWVTSVGASTHRGSIFVLGTAINAPAAVAGNYPSPEGFITQPLSESGVITDDVVAANPIDACGTGIDPIDGIALIARGTCFFDDKITNAVAAGASAVIVYTQAGNPKTVMGGDTTQPIPGVMIDNDIGVALLDQLTNGATVNATLDGDTIAADEIFGNTMAIFSARSPYFAEPSFIKPDVTAPGVSVLAGATPEPNNGGEGALFQYLDGTSMASPHVAGIAALLLEAHPAWSPAMIKSALMTTARQNLKQEDGVTRANPFDMGSGHIVPNLAVDPGLVYDYGLLEVQGGTCGTVTPLVTPNECNALANNLGIPVGASNLNLASIGVGGVTGPRTVTRTVTNVGDAAATYTVTVVPPPGFRVDVSPTSLTLAPGDSASYEVRIRNRTSPPGAWRFGSLSWTDGTHVVRSPIAVRAED